MSPGTGGQPGGQGITEVYAYLHRWRWSRKDHRRLHNSFSTYLPTSYIIILLVHSQRPKMNGKPEIFTTAINEKGLYLIGSKNL